MKTMDYRTTVTSLLQLKNKVEFYNETLNPTEVLNLSTYTSNKLVYVAFTCFAVL